MSKYRYFRFFLEIECTNIYNEFIFRPIMKDIWEAKQNNNNNTFNDR